MEKRVLIGDEIPLGKGKLITTLEKIEDEHEMSFEFKYSDLAKSGNVVHFACENADKSREPCIDKASFTNNDMFYIYCTNILPSSSSKLEVRLCKDEWHSFEFAQRKIGEDYFYSVTVDGAEIRNSQNPSPKCLQNVHVYAGDPWCTALNNGYIRNLFFCNGRNIEPELQCTLCLGIYKQPKLLHCMHTFCQECILPLCNDTPGVIVCPTCAYETKIEENQEGLSTNLILQKKAARSLAQFNVQHCSECETGSAVQYCCTCRLKLCEPCLSHHNRLPRNAGHKLVKVSEMPDDAFQDGVVMCGKHNKDMNYYCRQCSNAICIDCTHSKIHQGHSFNLMDEMIEEEMEKLTYLIEDSKSVCNKYETVYLKGFENFVETAEAKNAISVKIIEESYGTLINALLHEKEKALNVLHDTCNSSMSSLSAVKDGIRILGATAGYLEQVTESSDKETIETVLKGSKYLSETLKNMSDVTEKKTLLPNNIFQINASVQEVILDETNLDVIKTQLEEVSFIKFEQRQYESTESEGSF